MKTRLCILVAGISLATLWTGLGQPIITTQPKDFPSASLRASVSTRVTATGTLPLSYQWRFNGVPIPGKTTYFITLTSVQLADAGNYDVVVTNVGGSITSQVATLTVDPTFTKITTGVIVTDAEGSVSGSWADYDNDNYPEPFVCNTGSGPTHGALYHNEGGTNFSRVAIRLKGFEALDHCTSDEGRTNRHRRGAHGHGRRTGGVGAAAGKDPRPQAGHDAGTAHRQDETGLNLRTIMPVPDPVYFGPDEKGDGLNYGQIRRFGEDEQFRALQRRVDTLFVGQVNELARREQGKRVVYSPFPLFLMSCVGIETLGKIFFTSPDFTKEQEEDVQRDGFLAVCKRIDVGFSRPLTKEQKTGYDGLWGQNEHKKVTSIAHILYRFGRHTMIHGYRGKGVYLTEHESVPEWAVDEGAVVLNPYWFWERFKHASAGLWKEFDANEEPTNALKRSARVYLREILE